MDPDKYIEEEPKAAVEIRVDKALTAPFRLIKKFYKPLLLLIIIILLVWIGFFIKRCPVCEECEVCEECSELNCDSCPKKVERVTEIRYACSNGLIVDDLSKCNPLKHVKIISPYKETSNDVTLSIDKLEYETVGSYSKITEIDYTIINMQNHEIKPIVMVNLYSPEDERSGWGLVHEIFEDGEYIDSNSWVIKKKETNIGFRGRDIIVRLIIKDTLPDPDKELVRVSRPLEI